MRKIVAVIGDGKIEKNSDKYRVAFEAGKALVDNGYRVQSGGMGGVMEAAFAGAHASDKYREGDTVAIVPTFDANDANRYADISIPTGIDVMRNAIVANASAIVAVGGGAGTLSEIAFAWTLRRLIVAFDCVEGWSAKLANAVLDSRVRYANIPDDRVYGVATAEEMIEVVNSKIALYNRYHNGIKLLDK